MRRYRRRYVWELPVRFFHWSHVASGAVLVVTGYYIGNPFITAGAPGPFVPGNLYILNWMRFAHFAAAVVLTVAVLVRLYWFLRGNEFSRATGWVPFTSARGMKQWLWLLKEQLRFYLLLRRDAPHGLAHNPMAVLSYIAVMVLLIVQIVTGWALFGEITPGSIWWHLFSWAFSILSNQYLRYVHHITMWLLIVFFIVHLYLAVRDDVLGDSGTMTSIFSGWKYQHEEHTDEGS